MSARIRHWGGTNEVRRVSAGRFTNDSEVRISPLPDAGVGSN